MLICRTVLLTIEVVRYVTELLSTTTNNENKEEGRSACLVGGPKDAKSI